MQFVFMATYAIGDIQGCYKTLKKLLKRISCDRKTDRIFLVGDLVNRGPNSLDVLRWAKDMGNRVVSVLGNHDLHLLALAAGVATGRSQKTLAQVLRAKDRDDLLEWLVRRPLLYREGRLVLVHAGVLPTWTVDEALEYARKAEKVIRGKKSAEFLKKWYKLEANKWSDKLEGFDRHAVVLNAFTRMRLCRNASEMELSFTGKPEDAPKGQ
jgi:bis(5'-nucleosyl)-tetraphosphatase (symmetrical)